MITIDIAVAAGDWPAESALRELAEQAVAAAIGVLPPLPAPSRMFPTWLHQDGELGNTRVRMERPSPREARSRVRVAPPGAELSILFTDDAAIRVLNARYRGKDVPTNVLSFPPAPIPPNPPESPLLGDIVLAYETVAAEAKLAGKPLKAHMAHLIIHGFLHLLGYDHETDGDAETMEALERAALAGIGISDPHAAA